MSIKQRIGDAMKDAMRARDTVALGCLRLILASFKNMEIAKRGELDDADCLKALAQLARQRGESIEMFRKGGRSELAEREQKELDIVNSFLPEPLSADELERLVEEAVAEAGAAGPGDMGRVMKAIAPRVAGRADGKQVSEAVRARLSEKK